jgi:TRAP-type C4-dicarboxylate transport system permease small subunit
LSQNHHSSQPFLKQLARAEDLLLCFLLTSMLCLACVQIFLRSVLSGGLLWADPLLRYLVLWCGLLGALKATGLSKHIALDFSNYLIPKPFQPWVTLITDLFCTITSAGLGLAAYLFIRNEIEFGGSVLLSIPTWAWNIIFPITFGLMSIRYGISFAVRLFDRIRPRSHQNGAQDQ